MARPRTSRHQAKRQQLPPRRLLIAAAAAGAAALAIFVATALGGSGSTTPLASGCAIGDVSGSTRGVRSTYVDAFRKFATDIGTNGSGKVCLIVAAGDPTAESLPQFANVGPDPQDRGNPDVAAADVNAKVYTATADVSHELAHPTVKVGGSALVEAAAVAAKLLKPGDKLLFETDGVENSAAGGNFYSMDLSDAAIQRLLDRLERENLLPSLAGVEVDMPFLLYHEGGMHGNVTREHQIQRFWVAWAARDGARLVTRPW
jgi:hypothetical protein